MSLRAQTGALGGALPAKPRGAMRRWQWPLWLCSALMISACDDGDVDQIVQAQRAEQAGIGAIGVTASKALIELDETITLTALAGTTAGSSDLSSQVNWQISDSAVATISGNTLRALAVGSTTVTASYAGFSDSVQITVSDAQLQSLSLALAPEQPAPDLCRPFALSATGVYDDGSSRDETARVSWQSDVSTVRVLGDGRFVANAAAPAQLSATLSSAQGLSVSGTLPVTPLASTLNALTLTPTAATVAADGSLRMSAVGSYTDGEVAITDYLNWTINMTSGGASIAADTGEVTGASAGSGVITARCDALSQSANLTVTAPTNLASININNGDATLSLNLNDTYDLLATAVFSDGSSTTVTQNVTWSELSDPDDAVSLITDRSDNNVGRVTARATGTAYVQAEYSSGGNTRTAVVQITVQ